MVLRGRVSHGVVILENTKALPDGTEVRVEPLKAAARDDRAAGTLAQKLKRLAGKATGLPGDLARNHDHYLHGLPKR